MTLAIVEAVRQDCDLVQLAIPFTRQDRACPQTPDFRFECSVTLQSLGDLLKFADRLSVVSTKYRCLQLEGQQPTQSVRRTNWWRFTGEFAVPTHAERSDGKAF